MPRSLRWWASTRNFNFPFHLPFGVDGPHGACRQGDDVATGIAGRMAEPHVREITDDFSVEMFAGRLVCACIGVEEALAPLLPVLTL